MVKGEGCEFESECQILDGHFSHLFVARVVIVIKEKEAHVGPFLNNIGSLCAYLNRSPSLSVLNTSGHCRGQYRLYLVCRAQN